MSGLKLNSLRSLSLSEAHRLQDSGFIELIHACPMLEDLDLANSQSLTDKAFTEIGRCCPRLRKLDLSFTTVSDLSLEPILENCLSLQLLNFDCCENFTPASIRLIAKHSPCLRYLHLDRGLDDFSIPIIQELIKAAPSFPRLQCLYVFSIDDEILTTEFVEAFVTHCPSLCTFTVDYVDELFEMYPWIDFD
jgi:hypothetical protein